MENFTVPNTNTGRMNPHVCPDCNAYLIKIQLKNQDKEVIKSYKPYCIKCKKYIREE